MTGEERGRVCVRVCEREKEREKERERERERKRERNTHREQEKEREKERERERDNRSKISRHLLVNTHTWLVVEMRGDSGTMPCESFDCSPGILSFCS